MLIEEYARRASAFDLSMRRPLQDRREIALYGLAGEVGSLVAAVKKRLLAVGRKHWNAPTREIKEEVGDSLWYVFALSTATGGDAFAAADIRALAEEIGGADERAERIRSILGPRADAFGEAASQFLAASQAGSATLGDYQRTAFLTRRTPDDQLVEVCLIVLQQLVAELFRPGLPDIELTLNRQIPDRRAVTVLGETLWHLSAIASLYGLSLDEVASANLKKLEGRYGRGDPTPLHDTDRPEGERLPRRFEVAFVPVGRGRSRMYLNGSSRLGDDLTDNSHSEDGYRFHDAMHLALAAKLGWSPVLRRLMGKKRRSDPHLDEVEDGARAAIVEEALIKVIHAEGVRRAAVSPASVQGPRRLFADGGDVSFGFLRSLEDLVDGLEVAANAKWEWEDAILGGFELFHHLRTSSRGTVTVDLDRRSIEFRPSVLLNLVGPVAALGQASVDAATAESEDLTPDEAELVRKYGIEAVIARRDAMISALGLPRSVGADLALSDWNGDLVAIQPRGAVLEAMWCRGVVAFRVTYSSGHAQAVGIADP